MRRAVLALGLLALPALAADDVFGFIPPGGRTILADLLAQQPGDLAALSTAKPATDWLAELGSGTATLAGAEGLDEWQRQTLADYLGYAGAITDPAALPRDGRDMALDKCQSCHIITVVVTQARPREQWLGTMNKPSHVQIPLTQPEREQLADYLTVNAGIPIDQIPPELRAGGATY